MESGDFGNEINNIQLIYPNYMNSQNDLTDRDRYHNRLQQKRMKKSNVALSKQFVM